ncbi:MAG: GNAT family N-acetyltransferase [Myxococcota bacterium]
MLVGDERLSERDFDRLAELHVASIGDSIPSFLGPAYARHLYRFLAGSDREHVLMERVDGRIGSACVVSLAPNSVHARIARGTLAALLGHALVAFVRRRDFRAFVAATVRDLMRGGADDFPGPEIVYLFTDASLRGGGLGRKLIDATDALLRSRGESIYFVQTIDGPDNRALAFYANAGFVRIGDRYERGRRFALFHRKLERG